MERWSGDWATAAAGNQLARGVKGPFRSYEVSFSASGPYVVCPLTVNGTHRCSLEFLTVVFDANGALVNQRNDALAADISEAGYAQARLHGLRYKQEISVPEKGEYYLRVGVQDSTSGRIGALELPVAAVRRLPPLAQAQPNPTALPPSN